MRSLFLKIFLWFWATVIATGIALVLTFILEPRSVPSRWHETLTDTARYSGIVAVETAERDGAASASAFLERIEHETHMTACLFDSESSELHVAGSSEFDLPQRTRDGFIRGQDDDDRRCGIVVRCE